MLQKLKAILFVKKNDFETHQEAFAPALESIKNFNHSSLNTKDHLKLVLKSGIKANSEPPSELVGKSLIDLSQQQKVESKLFLELAQSKLEKAFVSTKCCAPCDAPDIFKDNTALLQTIDACHLNPALLPPLNIDTVTTLVNCLDKNILVSAIPDLSFYIACLTVSPVLAGAVADHFIICFIGTELFLNHGVLIHFAKPEIFLELYQKQKVKYFEREALLLKFYKFKVGLGGSFVGLLSFGIFGSPDMINYFSSSFISFRQSSSTQIIAGMDSSVAGATTSAKWVSSTAISLIKLFLP